MSVSLRHLLSQGPVIAALAGAAIKRPSKAKTPEVPSRWIEAEIAPRPDALVRDYVRNVGGDPSWYRGVVPAHLFPEWGFPLAARAMGELPYPLTRVLNAGCRIEMRAPLPAGEPLVVRARIESIDDDGQRAIVTQRVITGTRSAPEAVVADMRVFIPLASREEKREGKKDAEKARKIVPLTAKEIAFVRLSADAGMDFAKLTGDVNPIHWLRPYARAAGFPSCILHGFATLARAVEALNRARFAGDATRLASVDARFTKPLVLPANVGIYVEGDGVWVGDAPGGGAYLEGRFVTRGHERETQEKTS